MIVREHPRLPILVTDTGLVSIATTTRNQFKTWTVQSKFKKGWLKPHGYLCIEYNRKPYYVHELVAETFLGPRPEGLVIDHIDRNKTNNSAVNLRYVTQTENNHNSDKYDREHGEKPIYLMDEAVRKFKIKRANHKYYLKKKGALDAASKQHK